MRAFITGASGFIGGHLAERLVRQGWTVRGFDVRARKPEDKNVETVTGDIRDAGLLRNVLPGTDVLFHLASALGFSQIGDEEFYAINAEGTRTVLAAAEVSGVRRIVHFSSAGVLGHVNDELANESYPLNPQDIYDRSKLEGEKIAVAAARSGQNVSVVRPGWVYGPGDRRTFKLIRAIARGRFILVGRGRALQTPVYIDDIIAGALLCAEKGRPGEIYHLGGPEILPVKQIAKTIAAAAGSRIPRLSLPVGPVKVAAWTLGGLFSLFGKEAPLNPSRLAFFVRAKPLDIRKAVRELGYSPEWRLEKGMASAIAWYRSHQWLRHVE
jgi:nucleoside-diphosphate-sugar epimerase